MTVKRTIQAKIEKDLFSIADRLKEIDNGYFILFNTVKNCFEVHNEKQGKNTYALTVPYSELDSRTVTLVKSTRREYADNILNEIERSNNKLIK